MKLGTVFPQYRRKSAITLIGMVVVMLASLSVMRASAATVLFVDSGHSFGGTIPRVYALGDLDGDGDLDAFVSDVNNRPATVWLNDGAGVFSDSGQALGDYFAGGLALGDLDADGDLDVFAASDAWHHSVVWRNDGTGHFTLGQTLLSTRSRSVALGDLDGDGDLDAFQVQMFTGGLPDLVWLNDGTGHLVDSGQRLGHLASVGVALGDLDGDGDLDAYVATQGIDNHGPDLVWLNDGTGTFVDSGQRLGDYNGRQPALGDLDADGDLDAFVTNAGYGFSVYYNDGTGILTDSGQVPGAANSQCVALGDLDFDGDLDAFVANPGVYDINRHDAVWLNDGSGVFTDSGLTLDEHTSNWVVLGDVDGDGDLDSVVHDNPCLENCIRIWLNGPANQPPDVDSGGSYAGSEGLPLALDGATVSDPDGDELSLMWIVDSALCSFSDPTVLDPILTCVDNGAFTATLTVSDGVNDPVSSDAAVAVANVAPTIDAITAPTDPLAIGNQPLAVEVSFSDPGLADTHEVTWEWGDTTDDTQTGAVSPAAETHTYLTAGVYALHITVSDDDGGSDTAIYEFVVIYDPEGGFVTGGGWIESPEGAYAGDPTLTGKANFGFVSKYKKGASVPTGETEFQFKAGDLNFHSSSYDWLVVTGSDYAMFKGSGMVNDGLSPNGEAYRFLIWAGDRDSDTFRIKIWWEDATEHVVYDNGMDQPIGGGSIVIHTD